MSSPDWHIVLAQMADEMALVCRELDERPLPLADAPDFRRLGYKHRQKAREITLDSSTSRE